jgi:hypothetical protein
MTKQSTLLRHSGLGFSHSLVIGGSFVIHNYMAERKAFLLRIDSDVLAAVQRWADDDLRSLNGQIEFILRRALGEAGRASKKRDETKRQEGKETR